MNIYDVLLINVRIISMTIQWQQLVLVFFCLRSSNSTPASYESCTGQFGHLQHTISCSVRTKKHGANDTYTNR